MANYGTPQTHLLLSINMKKSFRSSNTRFTIQYAESASDRGIEVLIVGAGGVHLPDDLHSYSRENRGKTLLSILQMPAGIPVATLATGKAGSNAVTAASILVSSTLRLSVISYRKNQTRRF